MHLLVWFFLKEDVSIVAIFFDFLSMIVYQVDFAKNLIVDGVFSADP